jgi:hypothetical protein
MSALGSPSPLFLASAAADAAAGPIKSVRFNSSDSAHLTRSNPNEGSQRKFTFSFWVKRAKLGGGASNANNSVFFAGPSPDSTKGLEVRFDNNDRLYVETFATSSTSKKLITNRVFRDPSAWYHIVLAFDTTSSTENNRLIIYVNGEQVNTSDLSTNNQVAQNFDYRYVGESNADHWIGLAKNNSGTKVYYFNGYLTDFYFIDGAQKDETDFGEFDDNGVWQAVTYSGTYGSNGYHLFDFANESTVGHDSSGNEDDWTANNISSTAGAGNDILFDVPTNGTQSDTGAGGEVSGCYATLNPNITGTYIGSRTTLSNGNLQFVNTQYSTLPSTIAMRSGKWYCEGTLDALASASNQVWAGLLRTNAPNNAYEYFQGNNPTRGVHFWGDNTGLNRAQSYGASYATAGTVIGIAFDADAGSCTWYINGSSQGASTYNIVQGEEYYFSFGAYTNGAWTVNFGQRPFAYSAPSGYKALCTTNLPDATITNGSNHSDTVIYTGNGSSLTITGLEFSPDFVWLKGQSVAAGHGLFDTVRGATKRILSHTASSELTNSEYLNSFTSDGFGVGNHSSVNTSGETYAAWAWDAGSSTVSNTDGDVTSSVRANQSAGFSIVKWDPSSNDQSVGHGLNAVPEFIMAKALDNGHSWRVYHKSLSSGKNLLLDSSDPEGSYTGDIDTVSSTVFDGGRGLTGSSLNNNIAYCFTSVAGYSKFGFYNGNGLAIGPFVYLGFRPAWIMYKAIDESSAAADWFIRDYKRLGFNHTTEASNNPELEANASSSENNNGPIDILSNGFKIRSNNNGHNTNNKNYMYAAFAENPFQANGGLAR